MVNEHRLEWIGFQEYDRSKQEQLSFYIYLFYLAYFLSPVCTQIVPQVLRYLLYSVVIFHSIHVQLGQGRYIKKNVFFFIITEIIFIGAFYYGKWSEALTLINYGFGVFLFWIPLLFYESVIELPKTLRTKLKNFFWALVATVVVTTIIGNIQYSGASRYLASSTPNAALYKSHNIGDYQLVYGVVLLVPYVLFELTKAQKPFASKAFFAMLLVVIFLLAIVTQYATSAIIYMVEILVVAVTRAKNKTTMVLKCLVLILIFLLIKDLVPSWLLSLRDLFEAADSEWMAERCELLAEFISGKGTSGDMADRGNLYLQSWQAFCQSPWLGNLAGTQRKLGGHSEVLDILGATGIWGVALFLVCLMRFFKLALKYTKKENIGYAIASFIGFAILSSINTSLFPIIGILEFMSLPMIIGKD